MSTPSPIDVALEAATKAGELLLGYFMTELEHEVKDDKTFVTKADREAEAIIIKTIKNYFPDHGFLGEETGEMKADSEYQWVIDPLDGTANFVNSLPIWATSIALTKGNEVIAAVVHNPVTKIFVHAEKGKGLWCNGVQAGVSKQGTNEAMISAGVGKGIEIKEKVAAFIREAPRHVKAYRYLGSAALELALVAHGGTEGFVAFGNSKWDYAAGALLVKEAGGMITDFHGVPCEIDQNFFVASNGLIHQDILNIISAAGAK